MPRHAAILFIMMTMTGCTLSSKIALIENPEMIPGLRDGQYQPYSAIDPSEIRKVPRHLRAHCLSPGYTFMLKEKHRKAQTPLMPIYCPIDGPGKSLQPPISLARDSTGYRIDGKSEAVFMRLRGTIFLIQSRDAPSGEPDAEPPEFTYFLARVVPDGLDIAELPCEDFPTIAHAAFEDVSLVPQRHGRKSARKARSVQSCEATSLASIRPELDAEVQKLIDRKLPVIGLLRRLPDTAASAPAKPPH